MSKASLRRKILLDAMGDNNRQGINCLSCSGRCCTFELNSMKVTPLEALDLIFFLQREERLGDQLLDRLQETIKRYRLGHSSFHNGRRELFRRTYTCPFFLDSTKGCSISRHYKPYGCLGFNPRRAGESSGSSCRSSQDLLGQQQSEHPEMQHLNELLRKELCLDWDKLDIPSALLFLLSNFPLKRLMALYQQADTMAV